MSPEVLQLTILEYARQHMTSQMRVLVLGELEERRSPTLIALNEMIEEVDEGTRRLLFDLMLADGGKDLLPMLLKALGAERVEVVLEQKLAALANFKHHEALEALTTFEPFLPENVLPAFFRAISKLEARFVEYLNMRNFQEARGEELVSVADEMYRMPHPSYVPFLNRHLQGRDMEKTRAAVRILKKVGDRTSYEAMLRALGTLVKHRRHTAAFQALSLMNENGVRPKSGEVLEILAASPVVSWSQAELQALAEKIVERVEKMLGMELVVPFGFQGEVGLLAAGYLEGLLFAESGMVPNVAPLIEALEARQALIREVLESLLFAMGRIARRIGNTKFNKRLRHFLPADEPDGTHILVWGQAGYGDEPNREELLGQLTETSNRDLKRTILEALRHFNWTEIPHQILDLARDPNQHVFRRAALAVMGPSTAAPRYFEKMLGGAPLLVRSDVGKIIAELRLKACYSLLIGFINRRITDSFRLILLETLAAFDSEETGFAVQQFLSTGHTMTVRMGALATLYAAGGENRLELIATCLSREVDRHEPQIMTAFLELLRDWRLPENERAILMNKEFWDRQLRANQASVRLGTIELLSRCSWEGPEREGWSEILQRALSTLASNRESSEIEKIRRLIEKLSARFASEKKNNELRRQFEGIVRGLEDEKMREKLKALRQLDWLFRPEMVGGNPTAVKRLVAHIERFLSDHSSDYQLLVIALDVAGKIGHPVLHQKIRAYLDHPHAGVTRSANRALTHPVNEVLLANLIKSVYIMDDSGYITRLVTTILQAQDYQVAGNTDCFKGLQDLGKTAFDLLILDLNMPQMRGVDFLKRAREENVCPRFVFILTSVRTQDDLIEIFKEGVNGIILKPFRPQDLFEKIAELKDKCH